MKGRYVNYLEEIPIFIHIAEDITEKLNRKVSFFPNTVQPHHWHLYIDFICSCIDSTMCLLLC